MAIEEKAINAVIAELLTTEHGVSSDPEFRGRYGQPDISTRIRENSPMRVMTEAKIGIDARKKAQAVKDAVDRLRKVPECQSALALCYPPELAEGLAEGEAGLIPRAKKESRLEFVRVTEKGQADVWQKGSVADLALAIKTAQDDHGATVSKRLRKAIEDAAATTSKAEAQRLATELHLVDPKATGTDKRGAKIAFLILVNTMLIQSRLHQVNKVPNLASLSEVRSDSNIVQALQMGWNLIREIDYAPVVNPALAVLNQLGGSKSAVKQLRILLDAAHECENLVGDLRLDHAGPLYHGLLASAPYDGSFYTSTAAALILSHLVMPKDWTDEDWMDEGKITGLRVCDPACGTGTLLMAAASVLLERHQEAAGKRRGGGQSSVLKDIFRNIVEDVLYGIDINQHAVHLAAAMLTVSAPEVDYDHLNILKARHGVGEKGTEHEGKVFTGSLELLTDREDWLMPEVAPSTQAQRVGPKGMDDEIPDIQDQIDIVIMNPPFTRNDIRGRQYTSETRRAVQRREVEIAKSTRDALHQEAIDQSALETFFTPIADVLVKPDTGTVGLVAPLTTCTAPAAKHKRKLLATRFRVETVVTSHDNRRIYFSENTNIHECLIVARRHLKGAPPVPTKFINLQNNPATANEAMAAAKAIRQAVDGLRTAPTDWGACKEWPHDRMVEEPWLPAIFYSGELADAAWALTRERDLATLATVAKVEPGGQRIRDAIKRSKTRQNPDMRAFWEHKTTIRTTMEARPDQYLEAKDGREEYAAFLWSKRSHLLLANRVFPSLVRTVAIWSRLKALGSAFVPVRPISDPDSEPLTKAWCVWFNSTPGLLAYMGIRQKKLTYPSFSLNNLRSLPVPDGRHDIDALAAAYDRFGDKTLMALPKLETDEVRRELDAAVAAAVDNLDEREISEWRRLLAEEPSIHQRVEQPFTLTAA